MQSEKRQVLLTEVERKNLLAIILKGRRDNNPALWESVHRDRVTYVALRCSLRQRAHIAFLKTIPTHHNF